MQFDEPFLALDLSDKQKNAFAYVYNEIWKGFPRIKTIIATYFEVADQLSSLNISVSDNEIGIPEYLHPHLFKKNTPAGRPGLRGEKSIRMGLYIVKKLVNLMNGSISFDSEENKGSTFMVEFPKS